MEDAPFKLVGEVARARRGVKAGDEENAGHGGVDAVVVVEVRGKDDVKTRRVLEVRLALFGSMVPRGEAVP